LQVQAVDRSIGWGQGSARFHSRARGAGRSFLTRHSADGLPRSARSPACATSSSRATSGGRAMVRMNEAGAELRHIAAVSGHSISKTQKILETYLPRTLKMAKSAMAAWERSGTDRCGCSGRAGSLPGGHRALRHLERPRQVGLEDLLRLRNRVPGHRRDVPQLGAGLVHPDHRRPPEVARLELVAQAGERADLGKPSAECRVRKLRPAPLARL